MILLKKEISLAALGYFDIFISDFIPFVDPENIGVDTTIIIVCQLEV